MLLIKGRLLPLMGGRYVTYKRVMGDEGGGGGNEDLRSTILVERSFDTRRHIYDKLAAIDQHAANDQNAKIQHCTWARHEIWAKRSVERGEAICGGPG